MKYIRIYNDEIIGYQPAPNKYQKWYRPIDTYDKKYDRNLELSEDKQEKYTDLELTVYADKWYYDKNITFTNCILPFHFSDFDEIKLVVGFFLVSHDIHVSPNDWYIAGHLKKDTLLYKSLLQFVPREKPTRPSLMYYPQDKHEELLKNYNKNMEWYNYDR